MSGAKLNTQKCVAYVVLDCLAVIAFIAVVAADAVAVAVAVAVACLKTRG